VCRLWFVNAGWVCVGCCGLFVVVVAVVVVVVVLVGVGCCGSFVVRALPCLVCGVSFVLCSL
jgi:hypothetical protein